MTIKREVQTLYNIVTVTFKDSNTATANGVRQWDYGQILRIQGLQLPTAVEVHFALIDSKDSVTRIGITKDGVTDVVIPDSMIEAGKNIFAYVYLRDSESGQTEYEIKIVVTTRAKPEAFDTPEDKELFAQAIEAVNEAADRAEKAGQAATEAAGQAAEDAQQTAEDRKEVAKMVETVSDISEQVKKVEELSNKAQESATQAGTSATAAEKAKAQAETAAGKTAEDRTAVNQAKIAVDEVQEAVRADRAAVEEVKQSVEQLSNAIPESTQAGVQAVNQARQTAVDEIARTGTSHKTAVEAAGTQAVESVENVQQVAAEAVETAKTEAVQAVQAEGAKQIKEVQDKGAEVLQSIPEDFATQMETKLNKQQGIENKGKVLVIGEDGNVAPGEVQSGGGDGIAIINTMNGESPLAIPDSAERVNKRLELGGKTGQVQTMGVNLFDEKLLLDFDSKNYDKTQSGSGFYYYKFPANGTVTVSTKNANKNGEYLTVGIKPDGSDKTWLSHGSAALSKYKTLTPEDGNIYLGVNNNLERVKSMIQNTGGIIINEGSAAQPYEPYTGNKPSPSPEYPQEIKNSGKWNEGTRKYEVDVKVCNSGYLQKGSYADKIRAFPLEKGKTYRIYVNVKSAVVNTGILDEETTFNHASTLYAYCNKPEYPINNTGIISGKCKIPNNLSRGYTFTVTVDGLFLYQGVNAVSLNTDDAYIAYDFIKTVDMTSPYTEKDPLTITSDRPITKWDRLVEQGGQIGWLYATKKHVVTGSEHFISGGVNYYTGSSVDLYFNVMDATGSQGIVKNLSDVPSIWHNKDAEGFRVNGSQFHIRLKNTRLSVSDDATKDEKIAAYKTYLVGEHEKGTPYEIVYQSLEPEFIPLPQSEQNAIRALKTYYPTTVITVDGGEVDPDIKVTYTADTKNYIDGKVSAKVASILRQYQADTANLLSLMPMETQATMIENDTNNILNNLESEEAHE